MGGGIPLFSEKLYHLFIARFLISVARETALYKRRYKFSEKVAIPRALCVADVQKCRCVDVQK